MSLYSFDYRTAHTFSVGLYRQGKWLRIVFRDARL